MGSGHQGYTVEGRGDTAPKGEATGPGSPEELGGGDDLLCLSQRCQERLRWRQRHFHWTVRGKNWFYSQLPSLPTGEQQWAGQGALGVRVNASLRPRGTLWELLIGYHWLVGTIVNSLIYFQN